MDAEGIGTFIPASPTAMPLVEIHSTPMLVATATECCVNVVNMVACAYLARRLKTTRLMHLNLRTMLISMSFTLILFNAFRFAKSMGYFAMLLGFFEEARFSNKFCVLNRFGYDSTVNVLSLTMLGLIMERIAATCFVQVYEKTDSSRIACIIVALQWVFGICAALVFLVQDLVRQRYWSTEQALVTCSFVYTHPGIVLGIFVLSVALFCTFSGVALFLYYYNRRRYFLTCAQKLATRYQYKENVMTMSFLAPMIIGFGIFNLVSVALIAYMFVHIDGFRVTDELVDGLWKIEKAYNAAVSVFTAFYAATCLTLHPPLRDSLITDLGFCWLCRQRQSRIDTDRTRIRLVDQKGAVVEAASEADVYFRNLSHSWNANHKAKVALFHA